MHKQLVESRTSLQDWADAGVSAMAADKAKRKFVGLLRGGDRKSKGAKAPAKEE
eukprot:gene15380-7396_t